ncbi:DEAD/DEAH box helicase [Psychroflexus aestuariivivens]|uniref:DEAD/DEAH box helicase n=1 Tax=Psychroflexus aestuariivivens TaxID=1795040 RepID=UPI000FD83001|nr:DEAD/DEAH box helicase [Psychroflexus aestuariivivens]
MQIIVHPSEFHISIPNDHLRQIKTENVKRLNNRRWDYNKKCWIVPRNLQDEVLKIGRFYHAEILKVKNNSPQKVGKIKDLPDLDMKIELKHPEGFQLRDYQSKGVARGLELKKYINGDEQGLGKTLQSIATLYAAKLKGEDVFPALIICPASMKETWLREWRDWTGIKSLILNNSVKNTWPRFIEMGMADVIITNYESLRKYFVDYMPPKAKMKNSMDIKMSPKVDIFKSVIIDESHRCKDSKTQQTKLALRICMAKDWVILLTGTPVVNKPIDLFAQLAILGRLKTFGGSKGFRQRYCNGGSGASNLRELNYYINKYCFFRREKKDVAKDLPDKQRQTILCDITTRAQYNRAKNDFEKYLADNDLTDEEIQKKLRGEIMVKIGELKKISAKGKLNEVKEFVDQVVESGEKIIVFCNLHSIVDELKKLYPKAVTITGRDDSVQKQNSIDQFQKNKDCQVIICNIKAAGVGITLTASSRVAFVEYPWTYADCVQCEDRAHRIGQVDNVMCTYFLGKNTIDEDMFKMIKEKATTANTITGATDKMETNFVDKMLNIFKK